MRQRAEPGILLPVMKPPPSSPLALTVLALLSEMPMHPYRMQRLIEERGKDDVANVRRRSSLYQTSTASLAPDL